MALLNALLPMTMQQTTIYCKTWIPFPGQTGVSTCRNAHPILQVNSLPCSEELHPSFPPGVWTGFGKALYSHSCHAVRASSLSDFASRLSWGDSAKPRLEVPGQAITLSPCKALAYQKEQWQHCSKAGKFCTLWQIRYVNKWVSI